MPYCSNCGCELDWGERFCPACGAEVSRKRQIRRFSQLFGTDSGKQSREESVRRGVTNARFNEKMSGVLVGEVLIVSIALGIVYSSWWWFGGTLLAFIILASSPLTSTLLCYAFGIVWGVIGYYIGMLLFGDSAGWVIGVIAGICGIGANFASKQYYDDLG